ncbi:hypothetical protein ACFE04_000484 [Oxalis oulophora]
MKTSPLNLQIYLQKSTNPISKSPFLIPKTYSSRTTIITICRTSSTKQIIKQKPIKTQNPLFLENSSQHFSSNGLSRNLIISAASVGFMFMLMGFDNDHSKAMAFGFPEGPLVEEFWDNVRRYGLYALTVSTGAIWAIVEPIYELLKNPISAVLVVVLFVGGFFLMSQVLSAMVGVTEFSYDYGY